MVPLFLPRDFGFGNLASRLLSTPAPTKCRRRGEIRSFESFEWMMHRSVPGKLSRLRADRILLGSIVLGLPRLETNRLFRSVSGSCAPAVNTDLSIG